MATTARPPLARLLWLSVAAAIATIALKTLAWALTGSVGLLSDAAESVVNLVAALFALVIVHWAARPLDEDHPYGHEKADYLSAGVEGSLILLAALTIAFSATRRLLDPQPISDVGIGLTVSVAASAINHMVARMLLTAGREHRSLVLEADGRHLMTDVWTSVGVVAGVALVAITGFERLDPIIALLVAPNIVVTGVSAASPAGSWTARYLPTSAPRSRRCYGATPARTCASMPCARAAPAGGPSSRCTCSCPRLDSRTRP